MSLKNLLSDNRSSIIKKWRDIVISTYPIDTQRFLKKEKDRFSNPVGQTIAEDLEILYDQLTSDNDTDKIARSLDNIVRIRAVQDFKPSQAVGFVFALKRLIKKELGSDLKADDLRDQIESLDERIDNAALMALDIYSQCRQRIYELRVIETTNQVSRLLERANLKIEIPEL
ncbi:conserved hypothetical protein [uncultured Desulfobacterium sp.]|uniref:RsbT co-antagonist protein RsbRD N-terminal domain-containing protein n=1 Tax=uncultured Desulfobacterium sp. TaxID=201089 RepID=A0A445MY10_9BACT|nr:conserved hypothetical protein [uncultured Desulfobacterium sp.]